MIKIFQDNSLFHPKEMYKMSCTQNGYLSVFQGLTSSRRRKLKQNNMHLTEGMEFSYPNEFPILRPYCSSVDYAFHAYGSHAKLDGQGQAIHFFDYKFATACDKNLERTTSLLSKFDCIFTPDYSLYVDMPVQMNKHNIFLSRFAGAFWQQCGLNVIPTASWSNADSFEYCFEGLPKNSIIGVCGTGVKWCSAAYRLWQYGMRALEETLTPTAIIVYGSNLEVSGLHTPLYFIQDNISIFNRRKK